MTRSISRRNNATAVSSKLSNNRIRTTGSGMLKLIVEQRPLVDWIGGRFVAGLRIAPSPLPKSNRLYCRYRYRMYGSCHNVLFFSTWVRGPRNSESALSTSTVLFTAMNRDVIDLSSDLRHTSVVELDLRILRVRCVAESAGRWCFSPYHFLLSIGFITMKLATLALLCGSAAAFAPSQSSKVRM
jgi:hypothetical protein